LVELTLSNTERVQLEQWADRTNQDVPDAVALRSRIVLECSTGASNSEVSRRLHVSVPTVRKWRSRFLERRLGGLVDEPRPGRPPTIREDQVEQVVADTLESLPPDETRWSRAKMAERSGLSKSTIGRIWKAYGLRPRLDRDFNLATDPLFTHTVHDIVGLYLNPPEASVVLTIQEVRSVGSVAAPTERVGDARPRVAEEAVAALFNRLTSHDERSLALLLRKHPAVDFTAFLSRVERDCPGEQDMHVVCDNYSTHSHPALVDWHAAHPRFRLHFTPTHARWADRLRRLVGDVTQDMIGRADQRGAEALERDLGDWGRIWVEHRQPFVWTRSPDVAGR